MDKRLFAHIHSKCPKMNQAITRGLAYRQLATVEEYIDRIIRCAEPGFPAGLIYVGYQRCTPYEEFGVATMPRSNKRLFQHARSDVYMVKYQFRFNGEDLKPRYMYLPFASEAGLITIMGSTYVISPVLADRAVSVGEDNIFVPLNRDKLTFRRQLHHFIIDGQRTVVNTVWSNIHHGPKKVRGVPATRKTINANAAIGHYLFCKYGLHGAFMKVGGAEIHVGMADTINEENFPSAAWHICESIQLKPIGLRTKFYVGTGVRLAIRKCDYNVRTSGLVAAFFYVADRFPDRMVPEYLSDPQLWKRLMGHVIFASDESEGKLLNKMDFHMESLDGYVDGMVREWLAEDGVQVQNLYDLFAHIIETFSPRVAESGSSVASMYGKRLMVMRYVLIDIIKAIFNMLYSLQNAAKKTLTKNEVMKAMNKTLIPTLILKINHKHGEVANVSSPSDCMAFKVTSDLILQTGIGNAGQQVKSITIDSSKVLHASIAEVGQYNNLPKGEPTGRKRINPYATLSEDWTIVRDPAKAPLIDAVQVLIKR